jgi:hypothetical protein
VILSFDITEEPPNCLDKFGKRITLPNDNLPISPPPVSTFLEYAERNNHVNIVASCPLVGGGNRFFLLFTVMFVHQIYHSYPVVAPLHTHDGAMFICDYGSICSGYGLDDRTYVRFLAPDASALIRSDPVALC